MSSLAVDAGSPRTETFKLGSSTFLMAPELGFRLMKWSLATATGAREILYWPAELSPSTPFHKIRGGNPILFPFCGRSFDRGMEGFWRAPDGSRLPMPQHGFARDGAFVVTEREDARILGHLVPNETSRAAYPYDFLFSVEYLFAELDFSVTFTLENRDQVQLPWSAGHHFYFTLPWHRAARRQDYRLCMEARKCAYHGPDGKLVPQKRDRESCHLLSDPALLDRIHWELRHNRVSFGPKSGEEDIHLLIGDTPVPQNATALVTWSESEEAPYYCVEPWMGPPNAAEHGKGLYWVAPGQSGSFSVQVSLY